MVNVSVLDIGNVSQILIYCIDLFYDYMDTSLGDPRTMPIVVYKESVV